MVSTVGGGGTGKSANLDDVCGRTLGGERGASPLDDDADGNPPTEEPVDLSTSRSSTTGARFRPA